MWVLGLVLSGVCVDSRDGLVLGTIAAVTTGSNCSMSKLSTIEADGADDEVGNLGHGVSLVGVHYIPCFLREASSFVYEIVKYCQQEELH